MEQKGETTYKAAGVDIEAGYSAVRKMREHVKTTFRPEVLTDIGGFGGLFALDTAKYRNPVLVSGTDGVGTKLKVAFMTGIHDTVGIDAVAMCVNDIVVQGAEPLFFLDYLAVGKLNPDHAASVVKGIATGCRQAGCALIGGETAEMPGFYPVGEYDIAGFAVGVVDREQIIDGSAIKIGDQIIGLASNGVHSNGFSLVRHILFEKAGLQVNEVLSPLGCTLGEALLRPTRIYVKPILQVLAQHTIRGMAHITGGGLPENVARILPAGTKAVIRRGNWPVPAVFTLIQETGQIADAEMFKTFNMGIGMVVVTAPEAAADVIAAFNAAGENAQLIGEIAAGNRSVEII